MAAPAATTAPAANSGFWWNFIRPQPDARPWSLLFYWGRTQEQQLGHVIQFDDTSAEESVYSIELSRTLYKNWWFKFQFAGNLAARFASPSRYPNAYPIPEADMYVVARITRFPWSKFVDTTFAVGEGLSVTAQVPFPEMGVTADNSKRYLNFMTFEITVALPSHPEWQLVGRIHHRCAAWGTFAPDDYHAGSNTVGLGIRYYF